MGHLRRAQHVQRRPERGIAYGARACAVSRTVVSRHSREKLRDFFWVNGLPGVERQTGQQHAEKAVIDRRRLGRCAARPA